jgi:hypothetical protein
VASGEEEADDWALGSQGEAGPCVNANFFQRMRHEEDLCVGSQSDDCKRCDRLSR